MYDLSGQVIVMCDLQQSLLKIKIEVPANQLFAEHTLELSLPKQRQHLQHENSMLFSAVDSVSLVREKAGKKPANSTNTFATTLSTFPQHSGYKILLQRVSAMQAAVWGATSIQSLPRACTMTLVPRVVHKYTFLEDPARTLTPSL